MFWNFLLGILAMLGGGVVITLVQVVSSTLFPMPEGMDTANTADLAAHIATLPVGAFLLLELSYLLGALVAGATLGAFQQPVRIAGPLTLGGLYTLLWVGQLLSIPHPTWIAVLVLVTYLPSILAGWTLGKRFRSDP